jgi:hypothetical protein
MVELQTTEENEEGPVRFKTRFFFRKSRDCLPQPNKQNRRGDTRNFSPANQNKEPLFIRESWVLSRQSKTALQHAFCEKFSPPGADVRAAGWRLDRKRALPAVPSRRFDRPERPRIPVR